MNLQTQTLEVKIENVLTVNNLSFHVLVLSPHSMLSHTFQCLYLFMFVPMPHVSPSPTFVRAFSHLYLPHFYSQVPCLFGSYLSVLDDVLKQLTTGHKLHHHEYISRRTDHLVPGDQNHYILTKRHGMDYCHSSMHSQFEREKNSTSIKSYSLNMLAAI